MAASKELCQSLSDGSAEVVESPCSLCQGKDTVHIEVESTRYCVDCDTNMCAACTQWHARFPAMASHQVVDISKSPGTPAQKPKLPTQRCGEHHGRVIDHYCQDDDTVACETCVNLYHRNCMHMKYIPDIAKGTSKGKSWQVIKTLTGELITPLKQIKSVREDNSKQLDMAEAKSRQEVQDLRTRLYKHVDCLADAEDVKIKSKFQEKKAEAQKDIAAIDDQIDATETISKKLNDCQGDNESELFVYIKQGEKLERDVRQKLQTQRQSKVAIPKYKINSTIEMYLKDTKSLGHFEKMTSAKLNAKIKVGDDKDQKGCQITGICILPDASLIISDFNNSSLKLTDPSFKLAGYLHMTDKPFDVCYTDHNEVAVTLISRFKVQFVSVGPTMRKTSSFNVGDLCKGIAYSNNQLFVCCGTSSKPADACVHVYSLPGTLLRTIQPNQAGQPMFTFLEYITISPCGSKLHVTDKEKGVVTTDTAGKLLATYADLDLLDPRGVCCLDTGDMLFCDWQANCVHHISRDGRKLGKLLTDKDGIAKPKALCNDSENCRMFMSMYGSDHISVYDI